jgi:CheY-like chemotaxis protein
VEVIRRAGSGLLLLINEILDLSKIEAGRLELEQVAFDLKEVVDQAIDLISGKARAKGIELWSDVPLGTATWLIGDPNRLKQILVNLLGNAVKFTSSGSIVLTARNHDCAKTGLVEISVADTGIGIPSGKLESIFDDFTQADASTTRKYGGTGLGLGISRRLVEAMGGRLTATSVEGQGSTFRFAAQLAVAPETSRPERIRTVHGVPPEAIDPVMPARILVAEDSDDNRVLIEVYLKTSPYHLTFEVDGRAAMRRLAVADFDLILMDVQMPEMDGLAATRAIRALERESSQPPIPIIAMTANASSQDIQNSANAGCNAHLSKPVSKLELLHAIEKYRRGPSATEIEMGPVYAH